MQTQGCHIYGKQYPFGPDKKEAIHGCYESLGARCRFLVDVRVGYDLRQSHLRTPVRRPGSSGLGRLSVGACPRLLPYKLGPNVDGGGVFVIVLEISAQIQYSTLDWLSVWELSWISSDKKRRESKATQ